MENHFRVGLWAMIACLSISGLQCSDEQASPADDRFFEEKNAQYNGDYMAAYPLHNLDSCLLRIRTEVPPRLQPTAFSSLWPHIISMPMDTAMRYLVLHEQHFPHDTVHILAQIRRAELFIDAAKFDQADSCLLDAERTTSRLDRPLDYTEVYYLRGRMEMYRNNFSESRQAFFKCLEVLKNHDTTFSESYALVYHSIATSYERAQQLDQQRIWLTKMWNAAASLKSDAPWLHKAKAQAAIAFGIGYLLTHPDSSLIWAKEAERIVEQDMRKPLPIRVAYLLGRAHAELKQCGQAMKYLHYAYRKRPAAKDAFGNYQYAQALGHAYLCAGRLDSAEIFLREAMASPDTGNLAAAYKMLGEVAAGQNDFQSAWEHQKTSSDLYRAKFTADRIRAAAETDARYEALEQSKRLVVLEKEHQISRLKILLLALLLTLLTVATLAFYYRQRRRQKILLQQNLLLEQEKQLADFRAHLKSQELEHSKVELKQTKDVLTKTTALLDFKNQLIESLELRLKQNATPTAEDLSAMQTATEEFSTMRILTKKDWGIFQEKFSAQFPNFLLRLNAQFPHLTSAEIRLFLLIKIGFDTRQISEMLGISSNSVWRSRHRLVKSLGLDTAKDLDSYAQGY
jgi:hypothetical protein